MQFHPGASLTLFTREGRRKYLTPNERARFVAASSAIDRLEVGTLCLILAFTGCRITEALGLTVSSIDLAEGAVVFRTLKRRATMAFRQIPLPDDLIATLEAVHAMSKAAPEARLWTLSRSRAWQLVKKVMAEAQILAGPHNTPKGLRHGFGIHAIRSGVPLNLVQRWLGHASLATTAIYLDALGNEEREMAARMWTGPKFQHASFSSRGSSPA